MNKWPVHATWNGPIVMIGFGSIGRGSLPLILRHIAFDKSKMTVIDPSSTWSHLVEKESIAFLKQEITKQNY
ncbi:MAG: saccharopine dehydrogenase NADP-binding domain-containing protein, partial [Aestuariivirga sp.]